MRVSRVIVINHRRSRLSLIKNDMASFGRINYTNIVICTSQVPIVGTIAQATTKVVLTFKTAWPINCIDITYRSYSYFRSTYSYESLYCCFSSFVYIVQKFLRERRGWGYLYAFIAFDRVVKKKTLVFMKIQCIFTISDNSAVF